MPAMRFSVYHCSRCGGEVWVNKNNKNPSVSCRCKGRGIRRVAEGEEMIIQGREYLQLILPLEA